MSYQIYLVGPSKVYVWKTLVNTDCGHLPLTLL